ncbi:zinc finger CCCH domain-containing protein 17-like [Bidens hawaiensis]|uniref:zinc finger CCCH domain-containing protein 17-like n=1 Tax=Bidens hawaiensis TaxID=980011 RepID=UPI0040496321
MVGGTIHQQQQQGSQLTHQSSEEDEVLKRNTDCVYFLASPLTCKKGSECEFRHSDAARVNPRDCWYWLNGNCLNPKCAFRHPPLDGLLGSDVAATPMVPPASAPHATPYAVPKQGVACIFFQKGYCLKGPVCPFLHGPSNPVNNKPAQSGPNNTVSDPPKMAQQKKPVQKPVIEPSKMAQQVIVQKPVSLLTRTVVDKKIAPPARVGPPAVINEPPSNKSNRGYQASNNERVLKDDEYSREPSPGFDVLVDNEVEDSSHYYDVDHADRVDRDMYREHRDYDRYNDRDDHFDVDHPEKRSYTRNDCENELDLRQRLSKQRRGSDNGSRSVVNRESHADRIDRMQPGRDSRHNRHDDHRRVDQGSLSSRLRGRIKIPGRSVSPTKDSNPRVEREIGMERRNLLRYSPERRLRVGDRLNDTKFAGPKRLSELKGGRNEHQPKDEQFSGKRKHEKTEDGGLSFEGPKPLSEILKRKRGANNDNIANNKNNNNNVTNNTEDDTQKKAEIVSANEEKHNSDAEKEKDKALDGDDSVNYGEAEVGNEVDEDALLDEELEAYDENRDGDNEYEYEQMEGEEDYMEEGEEEYVDEEEYENEKKENAVYS